MLTDERIGAMRSSFPAMVAFLLVGCVAAPNDGGQTPAAVGTYRAVGQEPGWAATVGDGRMTLQLDYGERRIAVENVEHRTSFNGHRYSGASSVGAVVLDATHIVCKDGMSGMNYPDTVRLNVGGDDYRGCGGDPAEVLGGDWRVVEIGGRPVVAGVGATLRFDEGRVSGRAVCNSFGGDYRLTGEGLSVGALAATEMGCEPALMAQEAVFLDILSKAARFDIGEDGRLTIEASDGRRLVAMRGA